MKTDVQSLAGSGGGVPVSLLATLILWLGTHLQPTRSHDK